MTTKTTKEMKDNRLEETSVEVIRAEIMLKRRPVFVSPPLPTQFGPEYDVERGAPYRFSTSICGSLLPYYLLLFNIFSSLTRFWPSSPSIFCRRLHQMIRPFSFYQYSSSAWLRISSSPSFVKVHPTSGDFHTFPEIFHPSQDS